MSKEAGWLVAIEPGAWERDFRSLADEAVQASRRFQKSLPGDRKEAIRFDQLCRSIDQLARQHLEAGTPSLALTERDIEALDDIAVPPTYPWRDDSDELPETLRRRCRPLLTSGMRVIEIREPFMAGPTSRVRRDAPSAEPAAIAERLNPSVGNYVLARWRAQLEAVCSGARSAMVPSGVPNPEITEGLRQFAASVEGKAPVSARVIYRDGSEARPFPLRSVGFKPVEPRAKALALRVSLMSVRHSGDGLDLEVDAAWLRNRLISQNRPHAETDQIAYDLSRDQLRQLAAFGTVDLYVYQTGLEPAVVGFYRAVADHLLARPRRHPFVTALRRLFGRHDPSLAVFPRFFSQKRGYDAGTPWYVE